MFQREKIARAAEMTRRQVSILQAPGPYQDVQAGDDNHVYADQEPTAPIATEREYARSTRFGVNFTLFVPVPFS